MKKSNTIVGAIAGDVIGSVYEWNNIKSTNFSLLHEKSRFTDDTVLTIAVADAILHQKDYAQTIKEYALKYPNAGYGARFRNWFLSDSTEPYGSYGNGSAMRVSPVGFAFNTMDETLKQAKMSAEVTHNHPEGVKGAQAVAASIYLARTGESKSDIIEYLDKTFQYNLNFSLDEIRPAYTFDVSCQGSVPQAIKAFLESHDYESAVRLAVSIGGDSDTIACIAGGIAAAFYNDIPEFIIEKLNNILPKELIEIINEFNKKLSL